MTNLMALTRAGALMTVVCGWLVLVSFAFLASLIMITLLRVARFLNRVSKEIKLMRLELGKLAEEVHLSRDELKGCRESNCSAESG